MKTNLLYIGVIDLNNFVHAVPFYPGVNVITGRSATGKSALIEIFDYCFGSSAFTIPEGKITECAEIYFIVMEIKNDILVLARKNGNKKIFIKKEDNRQLFDDVNLFKKEYFHSDYFISPEDFKKELRKYFGKQVQITDADDNLADLQSRGGNKKPTPSIRSFSSFMLQHQNLIANKHAIFYRFDEKEKREQTIDFFKVFVGFVDQKYYIKKRELDELKQAKRKLEIQIPKEEEIKNKAKEDFKNALEQYNAISGTKIDLDKTDLDINSPKELLEKIQIQKIEINAISDEHIKAKQESKRILAELTANYRKSQNEIEDIRSSIRFNENFNKETKNILVPEKAEINASSKCPFCNQNCDSVERQVNELENAINWINKELIKSNYSINSFIEDEKKVKDKLKNIKLNISQEQQKINLIDKQIKDLENYNTQYELALKEKLKIEIILEDLLEKPYEDLEIKVVALEKEIDALKKYINENYDIDKKLKKAESSINKYMAEISPNFGFEESYKPVNLKFSLESFNLWNYKNNKKVYLRSMGSGENWLSCHITLFLALNRYFCELGDDCSIPTTLFFDQPSQVYFPSFIIDNDEEFSTAKIQQKEGKLKKRIDEDIIAVTNLYSEFVSYCDDTYEKTGIKPQIIVTDHADNLILNGTTDTQAFDDLVKGRRWRGKNSGFIQSINEDSPN